MCLQLFECDWWKLTNQIFWINRHWDFKQNHNRLRHVFQSISRLTHLIRFPLRTSLSSNYPLAGTKPAHELVDLTFGSFQYCKDFPTIAETIEEGRATKEFQNRCTPPRIFSYPNTFYTSPANSCCSQITIPSSWSPSNPAADTDVDFVVSETEPDYVMGNSSEAQPKRKKTRLQWKFENTFHMNDERKALENINAQFALPAFPLAKN